MVERRPSNPSREDGSGRCPGCDGRDPIGGPCTSSLCLKFGYHFIPDDYWEKLANRPVVERDHFLGRTVDEFLLVDLIGRGGFGTVYLALQGPLRMRRALKLMNVSADDPLHNSVLRRFHTEAEALATLDHPGIVGLIKHGRLGHRPYIVMEYVDAPTLRQVMLTRGREGKPFVRQEVLHIMMQALSALETAHDRGLVHRDVKPENLLLRSFPSEPYHVQLVDFGLAKYYLEAPQTALVMGTPLYMSPETFRGGPVTPAADIFSCSMMFLHLLTGLPKMYDATAPHEFIPPELFDYRDVTRRVQMRLPDPVNRLLARGFHIDSEVRLADARAMKVALAEVAELVPDASWPIYSPGWDEEPDSKILQPAVHGDQDLAVVSLLASPDDKTETSLPAPGPDLRWLWPLIMVILMLGMVELWLPTPTPETPLSRGAELTIGTRQLRLPDPALIPPVRQPIVIGPAEDTQEYPTTFEMGSGVAEELDIAFALPLEIGASADLAHSRRPEVITMATAAGPQAKSDPTPADSTEQSAGSRKPAITTEKTPPVTADAGPDPVDNLDGSTGSLMVAKAPVEPPFHPLVRLDSTPPGVAAFEAGRLLGTTPLDIRLGRGRSRRIVLKKTGYRDKWKTLYGTNKLVHVEMETSIW